MANGLLVSPKKITAQNLLIFELQAFNQGPHIVVERNFIPLEIETLHVREFDLVSLISCTFSEKLGHRSISRDLPGNSVEGPVLLPPGRLGNTSEPSWLLSSIPEFSLWFVRLYNSLYQISIFIIACQHLSHLITMDFGSLFNPTIQRSSEEDVA
ncbi:hypothetical protein RND71_026074 [Anisodus tanguticus]|uniref:Uncharacterized protein n=1 Tax=Anisodus tanguticus TaxID=243964 RepID=A0AAE1RLN9_9SOLA|nr:hypothetical protein RND71_026074 [Anisodus tanguticus]